MEKKLILPPFKYAPLCLKILKDFIHHHNLPNDLDLPVLGSSNDQIFSRIFDVILYSMGKEKRDKILKEVDEYKASLNRKEV